MAPDPRWLPLSVDSWVDTRKTLHLWLQIVGKIQLVSTPLINHWWNVAFKVSARGLRTGTMYVQQYDFDAEFDFIASQLMIRRNDGAQAAVALAPKSVAQFWDEVQGALQRLELPCAISASPNELEPATPFAEDTQHRSYDARAVHSYWRQLLAAQRVFDAWRAGFAGKDSPVQVFWGSMDLSCVRYSGRTAPKPPSSHIPNLPIWVMEEAESRENFAAGFWPGGSSEGSFYTYAYPEPEGFRSAALSVGHYDSTLGEWILPYEQVRQSEDPDRTLLTFLQETYNLAADLGKWDRHLLDIDPHRLDTHIYRGPNRTPLY